MMYAWIGPDVVRAWDPVFRHLEVRADGGRLPLARVHQIDLASKQAKLYRPDADLPEATSYKSIRLDPGPGCPARIRKRYWVSQRQFASRLREHDWYYRMSDDPVAAPKAQKEFCLLAHLSTFFPRDYVERTWRRCRPEGFPARPPEDWGARS